MWYRLPDGHGAIRPRTEGVDPGAKAVRSRNDKDKDASRCTDDGLALHSFRTLLKDLGTLAYNITYTHISLDN